MEASEIIEMDRQRFLKALNLANWHIRGKNGAAAIMALTEKEFREKLRHLGIELPTKGPKIGPQKAPKVGPVSDTGALGVIR
jgi:hypothetical protein